MHGMTNPHSLAPLCGWETSLRRCLFLAFGLHSRWCGNTILTGPDHTYHDSFSCSVSLGTRWLHRLSPALGITCRPTPSPLRRRSLPTRPSGMAPPTAPVGHPVCEGGEEQQRATLDGLHLQVQDVEFGGAAWRGMEGSAM